MAYAKFHGNDSGFGVVVGRHQCFQSLGGLPAEFSNTGYPRSELREMTANGSATKSCSSTSGTHTMVVDQAITHLPKTKPHVMAGQIHDSSSDVTSFRLEGTSLYITSYNTTHYKLVTSSYQLGTRFQGKFVAHGGMVDVNYNGARNPHGAARYSRRESAARELLGRAGG
ncbi:polysaccharide lyase family 7 protein [Streptomyces sp. NPDC127595]|uniref:polysaccharide lyase family 7 protein n=1 Tax=Streptomyces sp. NPDC127595 TaxID=3345405 RepID=UPI00363B3DED